MLSEWFLLTSLSHSKMTSWFSLLSYDKVETDTLQIDANPVNIIDLVKKTTHRFKVQAVNREISLGLQVQNVGENLTVVGDELRLGEV